MEKNNTITKEHLQSIIKDVDYTRMGEKTTICLITLKNNYEVVGSSACVDPENFDEQVGRDIAFDKAFEKLWLLEGYILQDDLARGIRIRGNANEE